MIFDTLNSMRKRLTWTNARIMLLTAGCNPGRGWVKTIEKLQNSKQEINIGSLQDALIEHNLCGDKFTKLYPITPQDRIALQNKIPIIPIADCLATKSYPNALNDDDLHQESPEANVVSIESNEDGYGVVLSTIVSIKKREEIDFESFDDPSEMRELFDEVIGMKFMKVQLFHVIWVPHHRNYLEVRVDFPRGLTETLAHGYHSTLKKMINSWGIIQLDKPVNLFPAVRRFYDDENDGIISEISFATTTGAIKNEKMLRRSKQSDQRKELYHLAGKKGLGTEIAVYRIAVEWGFYEDNLTYAPVLSLAASGPSGNKNGNDPIISGALIGNCVRATDYEFVIERLGKKSNMNSKDAV